MSIHVGKSAHRARAARRGKTPAAAAGRGAEGGAKRAGGAERELERTLASLQRCFDDALAAHAIAAADGRILSCNTEFVRLAGFGSVKEAISANLRAVEEAPGPFCQMLDRLRERPRVPLAELHFARRDGATKHALARLTASMDAAGKIEEIRVCLVDITERFEEAERLREGVELYHLAQLATQDVLWDWNLVTRRITWNGALAKRFRYEPSEVRASVDWHVEHIHPQDRARMLRGLERAIVGVNGSWSDEYRFRRGDGTYASVLDRAHIVRGERGEPLRAVGWILDISELRASEEAQRFLAEASATLDGALDLDATAQALARAAVPELADFCLVDLLEADGSIRRVAAAHELPRREEMLGIGTVAPPEPEAPDFAPGVAIRGGGGEYVEDDPEEVGRRLRTAPEADARAFFVAPIAAAGRVVGACTFGFSEPDRGWDASHFVTARELASRAGNAIYNARLYRAAESAARSRDELLRAVSHDLRDPLNTIVQTVGLLGELVPARSQAIVRWIDVLRQTCRQMEVLLESLLDSARMDGEHFSVELAVGDARRTILDACEMLRPLGELKGLAIEAEMPEELPPIPMDAPQIIRVLYNLVGNAIKFSPTGATIGVRAEIQEGELAVSVRDEGPGIPLDQIQHVFDRFWKGATDRRGIGLGLTIARAIVEAHGGSIRAESREGGGSTFTFTLPTALTATVAPQAS